MPRSAPDDRSGTFSLEDDTRHRSEEPEMTDTARNSRLELRVARSEKEAIERAAALSGSSTTDFVRSTMLKASERAVRAHEARR